MAAASPSIVAMPERTVFRVLEEAAEQHGSAPALNQPYTENGKRKYHTLSWIEHRKAAEEIARDPNLLARIKSEVRPTDDAILYLTSGATGEPKMVMVTHRALVSNIDAGPVVLPLTPQDRTVAFLPSAHIAQRVVVELLP